MTLSTIASASLNPYQNLAMEGALMRALLPDERVLFLWQNARTVVIGRNQDAFSECDMAALRADGGLLARRHSGGGAVYHDVGNLNFSFLSPDALHDVQAQCGVIVRALDAFGLRAHASGRNDIVCGGRKVSGCAFFSTGGARCHHGTLLVDADLDAMAKYLRVPAHKLRSNGVESVRARVANLRGIEPGITVDTLREALRLAFQDTYQGEAVLFDEARLNGAWSEAERARLSGWDWLRGRSIQSTWSAEDVLPFGGLRLELRVRGGVIEDGAVYSDAMDADAVARVVPTLRGLPLRAEALKQAMRGDAVTDAVIKWLITRI